MHQMADRNDGDVGAGPLRCRPRRAGSRSRPRVPRRASPARRRARTGRPDRRLGSPMRISPLTSYGVPGHTTLMPPWTRKRVRVVRVLAGEARPRARRHDQVRDRHRGLAAEHQPHLRRLVDELVEGDVDERRDLVLDDRPHPVIAAPVANPVNAASEIGASSTRSAPNVVVELAVSPRRLPRMSSPIMKTSRPRPSPGAGPGSAPAGSGSAPSLHAAGRQPGILGGVHVVECGRRVGPGARPCEREWPRRARARHARRSRRAARPPPSCRMRSPSTSRGSRSRHSLDLGVLR